MNIFSHFNDFLLSLLALIFADFGLSFQSQYSNAVPSSYMLYQNRQISETGTIIARKRKNGSGYHAQVTIKRSGKIVR